VILIDDDAYTQQQQRRPKIRKLRRDEISPADYPNGCDSDVDRAAWRSLRNSERADVSTIMEIFDVGWATAVATYAAAGHDVQEAIDTLLFEDEDDDAPSILVLGDIRDPEKAPAPEEPKASSSPNCVICLSPMDFGTKLATTKCGHVFCHGCISKWVEQRRICPVCRKPCAETDLCELYF